jgi:hypothetical protein
MLAANYDITLDRAADYSFVLTIQDASLTAVDVTNATFYADVRNAATKAQAIQFSIAKTTPASGIITLTLAKADTKLLKAGDGLYEWDIFMVLSGTTRRLIYGAVNVRPQFTNDV